MDISYSFGNAENEAQKLTTLQKSYKLSSEELQFPSTVEFFPEYQIKSIPAW